jgi:hypothetical protein
MANQETAHATLLTSMLGPGAAQQCKYQYPFNTVRECALLSPLSDILELTGWQSSISLSCSRDGAKAASTVRSTLSRSAHIADTHIGFLSRAPTWDIPARNLTCSQR